MLKLRDYQQRLYDLILQAWQTVRAVLAVCPTGGGKTVLFAKIIRDHNGASAAIVHRKEIVSQISLALARLGIKHRIVAPQSVVRRIRRRHLRFLGTCYVDQNAICGVASTQTIASKGTAKDSVTMSWVNQVTLAVYDEGHHYVKTGTWARAVEMFERAKLLFVTASPERADGKGLGADASGFVDVMVEGPTTKWLIDEGYLSPYRYYAPNSDLDVSGLAVTASGDFNAKALRERVVESHLIGDVVSHYMRFAQGQSFIVFNTDVETAEETAQAFVNQGVTCKALNGGTDPGERDAELDKFEAGENTGLTNVDLFDEGFDVPQLTACIQGRPTQSLAKFLQMVGRALRPVYADGYDLTTREGRLAAIAAGAKPYAIIIDPVRNWERHGMPDWPRNWILTDKPKGVRKSENDTIPLKTCLACTQPYEAFYAACPYCGNIPLPPERQAPEQVDGDLFELDVNAMAALFEKMQRADMSSEEYAQDQIERGIPGIGRAVDARRHEASKYRRDVLRNLVGWWIGMQPPERTLSEKHRRFYHRFKIDIGTAFTLPAKETDALCERIKKSFTKDLS